MILSNCEHILDKRQVKNKSNKKCHFLLQAIPAPPSSHGVDPSRRGARWTSPQLIGGQWWCQTDGQAAPPRIGLWAPTAEVRANQHTRTCIFYFTTRTWFVLNQSAGHLTRKIHFFFLYFENTFFHSVWHKGTKSWDFFLFFLSFNLVAHTKKSLLLWYFSENNFFHLVP